MPAADRRTALFSDDIFDNFAGDQDLPPPWEGLNKDDIHPQEGKSLSGVKTSDILIVCAFPNLNPV